MDLISHLKKQAKVLAKAYPGLVAEHPEKLPLDVALRVIAQLQGYPSWDDLADAATLVGGGGLEAARRVPEEAGEVYVVRVELAGTKPLVWRQIEIPCNYSLWELHVAIQDAMGWNDSHLHEFSFPDGLRIGIPERDDQLSPAVWNQLVSDHMKVGMVVDYLYDFGDMWHHHLVIQEQKPRGRGRYPRCTAGASLAPPDDCGGIDGWEQVKQIMAAGPANEAYMDTKEWLRGWGRLYIPLDPLKFDAKRVKFDNPHERFMEAFQGYF